MKTYIYNMVAENSSPKLGATKAVEEALNVLPCPEEGSTVLCATEACKVPQAEGSVITAATSALTDPLGASATPPNLGGESVTPNLVASKLGEQLKSTIRKATVLCTLCSVLLLSSCTHEEITAPANGLPQGMRAVSVDIRLPEGKPGFDVQSTDGRVQSTDDRAQSTGTRGISNSSPELGATRAVEEALNVLPCPEEGSTVLCATEACKVALVPEGSVKTASDRPLSPADSSPNLGEQLSYSSRTATTSWAEGDELMMGVAVGDAEGDLVVVALTLTCDENGTWDVLTDKSYSAIVLDRNLTIKPYTELPLLAKVTDLTLGEELTLMVDEAMGEVAYHQVDFYYAPEMELTSDGTSPGFAPKADASTTAPEMWTAKYEYNVATGEKHEQMWETYTARLRVYTGAEGDEVTLSSGQFWPYNVDLFSGDGTYTATTDADGFAYFYGTLTEQTSGFTVSLTAVKVGEGESAVTCPVSPVTLLEATDLVPVKLEAAKSYKLDASAKRPDTEKWAFFSSADITAEAVAAALDAGKSTIYILGEWTDAVKTAIKAQANGSIDLVLSDATVIGEQAFIDCDALVSVSLPSATSIENLAFERCSALTSVNLPAATKIGEFAFNSCTALESVNLPLATTIGMGAFNSCTALASVNLPAATEIGLGAFQSCDNLTTLTFGAVITEVGTNAFAGIGAAKWTMRCHLTLAAGQESHETYPANVANRTWAGYYWASITLLP